MTGGDIFQRAANIIDPQNDPVLGELVGDSPGGTCYYRQDGPDVVLTYVLPDGERHVSRYADIDLAALR